MKKFTGFTNEIITSEGHDRWDIDFITSEIRKGISKTIAAFGN